MALEWLEYAKARFRRIQDLEIDESDDFPGKMNYHYVLAKVWDPHHDDENVIEGSFHVILWPDVSTNLKCEAPNPPFETGENLDEIAAYINRIQDNDIA